MKQPAEIQDGDARYMDENISTNALIVLLLFLQKHATRHRHPPHNNCCNLSLPHLKISNDGRVQNIEKYPIIIMSNQPHCAFSTDNQLKLAI